MRQTTHALIAAYPVGDLVAAKLEEGCGAQFTERRCLGEFKRESPLGILRALRSIRAETLWVLVGDARQNPHGPLLLLLSTLTAARRLRSLDFSGQSKPIGRVATLFWQAALLLLGTVVGFVNLLRAEWETRRLMRAPRQHAQLKRQPPRIAYLKTNMWFGIQAGGSVGHVAGVVNSLYRRGYPLTVYAVDALPTVDRDISIVPITAGATAGLPLEIGNYTFDRHWAAKTAAALRRTPPDLIYHRYCLANYAGVRLARRFGVPLIVEYNGSEVWVAQHWGNRLMFHATAQRIEDVALRHAHVIAVVSDVLRQELLARGIEERRIVCYPNCVDPRAYDPDRFTSEECSRLRAALRIPQDALVCLFLGTFGPWHGVDVLADTVRRLAQLRPAWIEGCRARFVFVGDGQLMSRVRSTLADVPEDLYRLLGLVPQAEAPLYLAAADILISPHVSNPDGTRFFGSPTKLFEYMAMGRAIIASDLEQIGEVLAGSLHVGRDVLPSSAEDFAGRCALLTTPGSQDELVAALAFLAPRPDVRAKLGKAARTRVLERYTWDRHVDEILKRVLALHDSLTAVRWERSADSMTHFDDKRETQQQWNTDPCGANTAGGLKPGSQDFFRRVERERYEVYAPWMKDALRFADYGDCRVLEIGPGLGTDHAQFGRAGAQLFAVDLAEQHLRLTRQRFAIEGLATRLTRGDAEALPFREDSFDVVYAFGVLHHTPDMRAAVNEVHRVLRPGGLAIIGLYHKHSAFFWIYTILFRGLMRGQLLIKGYRRLLADIEYRSSGSDAVPLVQVLTRADCRRLFARFATMKVKTAHIDYPHVLSIFRPATGRERRVLERWAGRWGWYLIVTARK